MNWLYVFLFLGAFLLGIFDVPEWGFLVVFIPFVLAVLFISFYPVLFQKDINKIMKYLKKSKLTHYQFIFHLFNGEIEQAEKILHRVRSKNLKNIDHIMLLLNQKRYDEAREVLLQLKDNVYKWYYGAVIAIEVGDDQTVMHYKKKLKDPVYSLWIEMAEKVKKGEKAEALSMLHQQMENLRGLKLLSAAQYQKELNQK